MLIKVCGITRPEDAKMIYELGTDLLGLIFANKSPRKVALDQASKIIQAVGDPSHFVPVFVNHPLPDMIQILEKLGVEWVQLHGEEPDFVARELQDRGFEVIKAVRVRGKDDIYSHLEYPCDYLSFDTFSPDAHGGTGKSFDWDLVQFSRVHHPFFISGGISSQNIFEAIKKLKPQGVDISSSLESSPGTKDAEKCRLFFEALEKATDA